jgi:hypothetical protein
MVERKAITETATVDLRHYVPGTYKLVLMRDGRILSTAQFVIVR